MKERNNILLKRLDFFIGIPIVLLLGFIKKIVDFVKKREKIIKKENIKTIGIIKEAAIGDFAILSGVIKDIEKAFPEAKLILFCSESNKALVPHLDINISFELIVLPMSNPFKLFKKIFELEKIDLLFDFGQWPRINSIISFFIQANCKAGFKTKGQFRHYVYDIYVEHMEKGVHEIENFRNLLKPFSIVTGSLPSLKILPSTISLPDKYVVFHLFPGGSRAYLKKWVLNRWIEVGKYLIEKGYTIILSGGKSDYNEAEIVKWKFEHEDIDEKFVKNYAGISLSDTIYMLGKAKLVVSVDTGIVHLCSAIGVKLLGLYGPTDPERWGPLSENSMVVTAKLDCSPCISLGFETKCEDPECMYRISVEDVLNAINSLI